MRIPRRLGTALCVAGIAASLARPAQGQTIEGCWYFSQDADARALDLPWGVRLTGEPLIGWPGLADEPNVRVAVTLESRSATANRPFGYWQPLGPDSIRIGYPGTSGMALQLGLEGKWLHGQAVPGRIGATIPDTDRIVRLMRGQCPDGI